MDLFHAYVYGTSFWYATRAFARIYDPSMVARWFRHATLHKDTDLELYNIRTDAFGLAALALLLPVLASAAASVTRTYPLVQKVTTVRSNTIAAATILISVFHHVTTGWLAYLQDADSSTSTGAMLLGWTVSSALAALGMIVLAFGSLSVPNSPSPAKRS